MLKIKNTHSQHDSAGTSTSASKTMYGLLKQNFLIIKAQIQMMGWAANALDAFGLSRKVVGECLVVKVESMANIFKNCAGRFGRALDIQIDCG